MPTVIDGNTGVNKVQNGALTTANLPSQLSVNASAAAGSVAVDASGRVTIPNQPVFSVRNLDFTFNANGISIGGDVILNRGSCYNSENGRFTAPVAGAYVFHAMMQGFDSGKSMPNYNVLEFLLNGSVTHSFYDSTGNFNNHGQTHATVVVQMNAGDFMQIFSNGGRDIQNYFSGHLIG
jgi:hypothetical protein